MNTNNKFRNHFFIVIEQMISMWILWLYLGVTIFSKDDLSEKKYGILIVAGILLIVFIFSFLRWKKTTYEITNDAIVVERNTLTKVKTTISISNITAVNINRNVSEAILGTRRVKIDTNSSASLNAEVEIVLKKDDAERLQSTLMRLIDGEVIRENTEEVTADEKEKLKTIKKASLDDIFFHCIFTMKIVEIVVASVIAGFMLLSESEIDEGESAGGIMSVISFAIFVVGIIISFMKSFFAFYKLESVRCANEINISYGFFDKKEFRVPVSKIVSLKVKQPLIGRIFKKAYAEIVCVGMGNEENEMSLLSLCMDKKMLAMKLHKLLPEFIPEEVANVDEFYCVKKEPKKGLTVRVCKSIFYMLSLIIGGLIGIAITNDNISEIFGVFGVVLLTLCLLILLYGVFKNLYSGYSLDKKFFRIVNGAFNKEMSIVPYKKIEYMQIKKTPVHKIYGLSNVLLSTKSGALADIIISSCYMTNEDIVLAKEKYHNSYKRA